MDSVSFHLALALVGLILFVIAVIQSRATSIVAWAGVATSLGLVLYLNTQV